MADPVRDNPRHAAVLLIDVINDFDVNDNFGLWYSERAKIVELLAPQPGDYFVIKPRHSGFYATNLPVLLPHLKARRLAITGFATDICVLFTANDAYMRSYALWVPENCTAASTPERTREAVDLMDKVVKAETRSTSELALADWLATASDSF